MTPRPSSRALRWSAPAAVAAALVAWGVVPRAVAAPGHPHLPARTPAQLLVDLQRVHVTGLTGTVAVTADLGLPQLPDRVAGAGTGFASLLTGTHTLKVWADGPARQRVAVLGDLAETDIVHNGRDVWVYDSTTQTVDHVRLPAMRGPAADPAESSTAAALTPQQLAARALAALDPSTRVTVDTTATVAGRSAYQLVLRPRTTATLIGSVRIAVDAATYAPLRVQVFPRGGRTPALQVGYTSVSFSPPAGSVFRFRTPPGATVHDHAATPPANGVRARPPHLVVPPGIQPRGGAAHGMAPHGMAPHGMAPGKAHPTVSGTGWAAVLELPGGLGMARAQAGPGGSPALLDRLTTAAPDGGRLLSTRLFTVLLTRDGRVFAGAVPAATLEAAAAAAHA